MADVVSAELDRVAPLRTVVRRRPNPTAKWLSPEAVAAKRKRRRLERKWKASSLETDRVAYRSACRVSNNLINQSRQDHYRQKLDGSDPKQRWQTAKELLHSKDRVQVPSEADGDRLCSEFSAFFVNKITDLKNKILSKLHNLKLKHFPNDPPCHGQCLSSLPPVTPEEVHKLLTSTVPKSSRLDFVPTSILKSCAGVFLSLLLSWQIYRLNGDVSRLSSNLLPSHRFWKSLVLTKKLPVNYRPISNLNNISKILEKLFLVRFQPHVTASPNYNPYQSAYRKKHSTETALTLTLDNIFHASDRSKSTILVALDLSAAFDLVDHELLISRLKTSFGIDGLVLQWILSYLTDRSQFVSLGSSTSPPTPCSIGVPQGSVLGPLSSPCISHLWLKYCRIMVSLISSLLMTPNFLLQSLRSQLPLRYPRLNFVSQTYTLGFVATGWPWMLINLIVLFWVLCNEQRLSRLSLASMRLVPWYPFHQPSKHWALL